MHTAASQAVAGAVGFGLVILAWRTFALLISRLLYLSGFCVFVVCLLVCLASA